MTNSNEQYKVFKYYEGLCSSGDFTKEIAKVLALGVKSKPITDLDGRVINEPTVLPGKNWDIVYPKPDADFEVERDESGEITCTPEEFIAKINNQVDKISDTVIMKTRTSEKKLSDEEYDDLTVDPSQNASYLDMYLEIYKPAYIANPEEYPLDCERKGIVPRLVTKELYEDSFRSKHEVEDVFDDTYTGILNNRTIQKSEITDDSYVGISQHMTYDDLANYITAIREITSDSSFDVPSTTAVPSTKELNKGALAKIKQESVAFYNFLRSTMGVEAEDYILLEKADLEISIESTDGTTLYQVLIRGFMRLITYTITAGTELELSQIPNEDEVVPEMRLNGIYVPIAREYFKYIKGANASQKSKIQFVNNYTYESTRDGMLCARYSYTHSIEDNLITERVTLLNNHYVLMRLFDRINYDGNGPAENVYNASGDIIQTNSHVSEWSKLSWYRDFEEIMLDFLDEDVSTSTIADGNVFVPIETPGLNADTKIRYWINTNNDRFSLIVMGNPSLDYTEDRHLIGACYCGAIESFENSINDTAGNFALFTSSSTEPCNTILQTEKVTTEMSTYALNNSDVETASYNTDLWNDFLAYAVGLPSNPSKTLPDALPDVDGTDTYYISLPENTYFDRSKWPKYVIIDSSNRPVTGLTPAAEKEYVQTTEDGKSGILKIKLNAAHDTYYNQAGRYKFAVIYAYYKEKVVITSGITRDVFGNVTNVDKVKTYGKNTSDGTTSIMMYHTRSKAYYQKHHMLFATTEEYMSKVMYGKSMYTGEYYADRIKVTHGNDGPRGILSDLLVIDSASLYALDELVINKDFEKDKYENEETFIYFPISTPYSPLSDSPNATYGLAIKKEEKEPKFTDEISLLKKAVAQLDTIYKSLWRKTTENIIPLEYCDAAVDEDGNMCSVYWKVLEDTAFKVVDGTEVHDTYVPLQIAVINTSAYQGERDNAGRLIEITDSGVDIGGNPTIKILPGTQKSDGTRAYVKIAGFTPSQLVDSNGDPIEEGGEPVYEDVVYGISDTKIEKIGQKATVKAVINDGSLDVNYPAEDFIYPIYGVPYDGDINASYLEHDINETPAYDIMLLNAKPDKYLVLYSVETKATGESLVSKFACVPLKDTSTTNPDPANALLQYPCEMIVLVENGGWVYKRHANYSSKSLYIPDFAEYNSEPEFVCVPEAGYEFDKIIVEDVDANTLAMYDIDDAVAGPDVEGDNHGYATTEAIESDAEFPIIKIGHVTEDIHVRISFKKKTNS